jgi:hypothetical protein
MRIMNLSKKKKSLILAVSLSVLLLLTGCSALLYYRWKSFEIEDLGIELKVPSEPRHFRMAAGTTQGIAEFEQWTITDVKSSYQFYIVSGDHEYEEIDLFMQAEVLNAAPRPAVGFMVKAIETGSRRFVQGELLVEEQSWLQEDRRSRAISRTYVLPGKILQLICVFPSEETDRASVSYFFDSFKHKD